MTAELILNKNVDRVYMISIIEQKIIRDIYGVKRLTKKFLSRHGYTSKNDFFNKERLKIGEQQIELKKAQHNFNKRLVFKKFENQYKSYAGYRSRNKNARISDISEYRRLMQPIIRKLLKRESKKSNIKIYSNFSYTRDGSNDIITFGIGNIRNNIITNNIDINTYIDDMFTEMKKHLGEYNGVGFKSFKGIDFGVNKYTPISGSSYVENPPFIKNKNCCVNVKNVDNKCFLWSVLSSLYPAEKHSDRLSKYKPYESKLKLGKIDIKNGMKINDIEKFEKMNKLKVNVYSLDDKNNINILYHTKEVSISNPINLFWYNNHYSFIKNFSRFSNNKGSYQCKTCTRCLQTFKFNEKLIEHQRYCDGLKPMMTILPKKDGIENILKYDKDNEKDNQKLVIYADFECITSVSNKSFGMSQRKQKHKPASYMFKIVSDILPPNTQTIYSYTGKDAHIHFVNTLNVIEKNLIKIVSNNGESNNNPFIPIIFHNLKGYDSHLIFKAFMTLGISNKDKLKCIPQNSEKFISFSYNTYRFLDSISFLNDSLDNLVSNLDDEQKINLKEHFKNRFDLVNKKGSFPYDWFNDLKKLERKSLPEYKYWHSTLYGKNIGKDKYEHAIKIWNKFDMKKFEDYHDVYLYIDVLGLADVFEHFRKISIRDYGLDPLNYYTLPGFSFDAMLKMTDVKLELLTDVDKYLFVESGIRGGLSVQSHRLGEANEPQMKNYDKSKPNKFNMYLDANNLYGYAMMKKLPVSEFKWMNFDNLDIDKLDDCILEVDVDYPPEIHDLHNDFPLMVESSNIEYDEISEYSKSILKMNNSKFDKKNRKLLGTLKNKRNYVIHIDTLKYALKNGLILKKIHKGLSFKSSCFLKEYIDFNSNKRANAKNDFEKDFYKLMNNATYGKCLENVRARISVKFVNNSESYEKLVRKPQYKRNVLISDNGLTGVEMHKMEVQLNKPIYLGFAILEYSKLLMQEFHYDFIKKKYKDNAKLLFTDTDSLCYCIKTENIYSDMKENSHLFDFSNYPKNHSNYSDENKKVVGKMKDESGSRCIEKFVGLKSKMYSLLYSDKCKNTAKGIQKCVSDTNISFSDYYNTLKNGVSMRHTIKRIMSKKHEITMIEQNKISLSAYDDKRFILDDGINTLAYGHYSLLTKENKND